MIFLAATCTIMRNYVCYRKTAHIRKLMYDGTDNHVRIQKATRYTIHGKNFYIANEKSHPASTTYDFPRGDE